MEFYFSLVETLVRVLLKRFAKKRHLSIFIEDGVGLFCLLTVNKLLLCFLYSPVALLLFLQRSWLHLMPL